MKLSFGFKFKFSCEYSEIMIKTPPTKLQSKIKINAIRNDRRRETRSPITTHSVPEN